MGRFDFEPVRPRHALGPRGRRVFGLSAYLLLAAIYAAAPSAMAQSCPANEQADEASEVWDEDELATDFDFRAIQAWAMPAPPRDMDEWLKRRLWEARFGLRHAEKVDGDSNSLRRGDPGRSTAPLNRPAFRGGQLL
jgi:hypothetical protein